MGVHHAREWPSGELAMEFAVDLAKSYGSNARITGLLKKARVIVVPVVNADGFELSRTDGEYSDLRDLNGSDPLEGSTSVLATPGQTYKRKNCRVVDGQDTPDGSCRATLASPGGFGVGRGPQPQLRRLLGRPGRVRVRSRTPRRRAGRRRSTRRTAARRRSPSRRRRTSRT